MRHVRNNRTAPGANWWRLCVAVLMAACASAAFAQSPGAADSKYGSKPTRYRVVNLAPGLLAALPKINASGQVSFSMQAEGGAVGYFYNGSTVQHIGTLGAGDIRAIDLNNPGQIAGNFVTGTGTDHAFIWRAGAGMLDLGPDGGYAVATAINNHGVITGAYLGAVRAFRWSAETGIENLGAFPTSGGGSSFGSALNDAGVITGTVAVEPNRRHAFIWTRAGGLVDIDTLNSYDALPMAIARGGEVAGNRLDAPASALYHPFLWTPAAGMVDLGVADGVAAGVGAITADLHMAGVIVLADGNQRAMAWSPARGMRNLGTLGGATSSANDINAQHQVVGSAFNRAGARRAFAWTEKTGMQDLNRYLHRAPPGLVVDIALAINDSGAIVATSNAGLVLLRPDRGHTGGHVVGPVVAPAMVKVGAVLRASVDFVDEDQAGTRSVTWDWGDATANAGTIDNGTASASHNFSAPGIYTVSATVVDRRGRSTVVSQSVVATAAAGNALAGAGSVVSPMGAFRQAPLYVGPATFSMIAPSTARVRGEQHRLHFDVPGLPFRSQDMQLLERHGAQRIFVGTGTVRGAGNYRFRLSTSTSEPAAEAGRFALKIWHVDPASQQDVVDYDNADALSGAASGRVRSGRIVQE